MEFVKLLMIMLDGQIIISGDKKSVNSFQIYFKKKNKVYSLKSKRPFSLFIDEICCRKNEK